MKQEDDKQLIRVQTYNVKPSLATTKKLAKELTRFIDDNKLSVWIAGKRYIEVEGWQFAGSQLNLSAIVIETEDISKDTEIRYKATVEVIHNPTGSLVSRGFALCSNKEFKKKKFDEYAVASMAQTRAIGKAYRNILSWLIKLAGFEGTPREEIGDDTQENMEAELAKAKKNVLAALNEAGITTATDMIAFIHKVLAKDTIETVDDAFAVIAELEKDETN